MLEPLGSDLWFADGGVVSFKGFDYPTRMVVVRLADGGLWLWSPVERTTAIGDEVRALGPVRHIVSPNKLHYLFLGEWQTAFPEASLWATAATVAKCKDSALPGYWPTIRLPSGTGRSTSSISPIRLSWTK
jgi:hypothetical protein